MNYPRSSSHSEKKKQGINQRFKIMLKIGLCMKVPTDGTSDEPGSGWGLLPGSVRQLWVRSHLQVNERTGVALRFTSDA